MNKNNYTIIIVGAGLGRRSSLETRKVLYPIDGKAIYLRVINLFMDIGFNNVIFVAHPLDVDSIKKTTSAVVVPGGSTRGKSVQSGLAKVNTKYVLIHDAARPFTKESDIEKVCLELESKKAVFLANRVTDSIKEIKEDKIVSKNRDFFLSASTPQGFLTSEIGVAYNKSSNEYSDDISLYEAIYGNQDIGYVISDQNDKLTFAKDFENLNNRYLIGHSFDVHKLVEHRRLVLGGVEIKHDKGLLGHSDADCLTHAIAEAVLGALALGDLGTHFPDNSPKYKNISSLVLLEEVVVLMKQKGYGIINVDAICYAEKPKLFSYITAIRKTLAKHLDVGIECISVKATTHEGLGDIGEEKAIAAEAVVLLKRS